MAAAEGISATNLVFFVLQVFTTSFPKRRVYCGLIQMSAALSHGIRERSSYQFVRRQLFVVSFRFYVGHTVTSPLTKWRAGRAERIKRKYSLKELLINRLVSRQAAMLNRLR